MIDIVPLNINNRNHFWRFNNHALIELAQLTNTDPAKAINSIRDLSNSDLGQALTYIIYSGITGFNKQFQKYANRLSIADVASLIAQSEISLFNPVINAFNNSVRIGKFLETIKSDQKGEIETIDWTEIFEFAISDIGLMPDVFLSLTWYEYSLLLAKHLKNNARQWEHTRFISYWTYWSVTDAERDSITDFLPLITDPEPEPTQPLSSEEINSIHEEADARIILFNKLKNG